MLNPAPPRLTEDFMAEGFVPEGFVIGPLLPWIAGDTALPPTGTGSLDGTTLVVKDVIDVQGLPTGAGHPQWLAERPGPAARDADAVAALRAVGAVVVGKTHTDELAYSLGGTNAHYGAPVNPAAPDRVCGGSSSGTASAVALGLADLGLGTDTAGSIRVPASFCGLYGFRPSTRRVSQAGTVPLAPSFDVPGLLARDPRLLAAGARALFDPAPTAGPTARSAPARLLLPEDLWARVPAEVRAALAPVLDSLRDRGLPVSRAPLFPESPDGVDRLERLRSAFATVQAAEVWAAHGGWVRAADPAFGPGVAERLLLAQQVTVAQEAAGRAVLAECAVRFAAYCRAGDVLALPAAPGPAPLLGRAADPARRTATLLLTCLASSVGAPALALPGATLGGAPLGLCLVAAPGADELLLDLAADRGTVPARPAGGAR